MKNPKQYFMNGLSRLNNGFRAVLFTPELAVKDVHHAVRHNVPTEIMGTRQVAPEKGDLMAKVKWFQVKDGDGLPRCIEKDMLMSFDGEKFSPLTTMGRSLMWPALRQRHKWLDGFLSAPKTETESSFIPTSVVSEKDYLCNQNRTKFIQYGLSRFGVDLPFGRLLGLPRNAINFEPNKLDVRMDSKERGENEKMFGSFGDGSKAVELDVGKGGVKSWRNYPFIVRVTMDDGAINGVQVYVTSWKLVRNLKQQQQAKAA